MGHTIKEIPFEERPRERCLSHGAECLGLRELLAVLIGTGPKGKGCLGLAEDLIRRSGGGESADVFDDSLLFKILKEDGALLLTDLKGLGVAARARLLASFEFARRYNRYLETNNLTSRADLKSLSNLKRQVLKTISKQMRESRKEWVGVIPIYSPQRVGEFCLIEWGTRFHTNFDARTLFSKLFTLRADGFFLAHNHPSGNCDPSQTDYSLTQQMQWLGQQLNIRLIDHCIVSSRDAFWLGNEVK